MAFPNRRTTDAGMVTGLLVGMFTSIIALSALVFDGARLVAARAELEDHAANAGRAAAQEVIDIRLGAERIDPVAGREAALRYLELHGLGAHVGLSQRRVAVERTVWVIDS